MSFFRAFILLYLLSRSTSFVATDLVFSPEVQVGINYGIGGSATPLTVHCKSGDNDLKEQMKMFAIPTHDPFKATTVVLGDSFGGISLILPWWLEIQNIRRLKSSEGYSVLPYTLQLLTRSLWLVFSFRDPENTFFLTNLSALGLLTNLVYTAIHFYYGGVASRWRTLCALLFDEVIIGLTLLIDRFAIRGPWYPHFLVTGIAAYIAGVSCHFPTIMIMIKVIQEKNSIHISLWPTISSLLGHKSWILYGISEKELMICVPNILGVLVAIAHIALLYIYPQISVLGLSVYASATSSLTPPTPTPSLSSPPATPTPPMPTLTVSSPPPTC